MLSTGSLLLRLVLTTVFLNRNAMGLGNDFIADTSVVSKSTANETAAPTATPTSTPTSSTDGNSTLPPTSSPTVSPTSSPTISPTSSPTSSPTTQSPTPAHVVPTDGPTFPPSPAPENKHHHSSFGKKLLKAIGWMTLIVVSGLLFAAAFSNRFRIYYVLREMWFTFRQYGCTRWIVRNAQWLAYKTMHNRFWGGGGPSDNGSLNEVIFDDGPGDLTEGLLMG